MKTIKCGFCKKDLEATDGMENNSEIFRNCSTCYQRASQVVEAILGLIGDAVNRDK